MLILILIDVQYLSKVVFSFEKGPNGQDHSSSSSPHPIKKIPPPQQIFDQPSLRAICKALVVAMTTDEAE